MIYVFSSVSGHICSLSLLPVAIATCGTASYTSIKRKDELEWAWKERRENLYHLPDFLKLSSLALLCLVRDINFLSYPLLSLYVRIGAGCLKSHRKDCELTRRFHQRRYMHFDFVHENLIILFTTSSWHRKTLFCFLLLPFSVQYIHPLPPLRYRSKDILSVPKMINKMCQSSDYKFV